MGKKENKWNVYSSSTNRLKKRKKKEKETETGSETNTRRKKIIFPKKKKVVREVITKNGVHPSHSIFTFALCRMRDITIYNDDTTNDNDNNKTKNKQTNSDKNNNNNDNNNNNNNRITKKNESIRLNCKGYRDPIADNFHTETTSDKYL